MSSPRSRACLLLLAGLTLRTLQESAPERAATKAGDDWILSGDFHVHGFPCDGALPPWASAAKPHRPASTCSR